MQGLCAANLNASLSSQTQTKSEIHVFKVAKIFSSKPPSRSKGSLAYSLQRPHKKQSRQFASWGGQTSLKSWIRTRCRPSRSIDLLVRANLAPFEKAVEAWRAWQSIKSIEDATWSESRLLAPLARRIASLDPGFPYQKRLEGVAKSQWTRTQLTIRDSVPALDVLRNAGIDLSCSRGAPTTQKDRVTINLPHHGGR